MNHQSSLFKGLFGVPLDATTNQAQMVGAPPQVVLGLADPGLPAMNLQAEEPQAPVAQPDPVEPPVPIGD